MMWRKTLLVVCFLTAPLRPSLAWAPAPVNWARLVDEAELIVVAHVVGNLTQVEHVAEPEASRSWEYYGRLAIDEVLEGEAPGPEVLVVLHHGLTASQFVRNGEIVKAEPMATRYPGLAILNGGSDAGEPILEDARQPAIWLLAHYTDRFRRGGRPTEGSGVGEPEHIQPLKMVPLFRAILRPAPVEGLVAFLRDPDTEVRAKALMYLRDRGEAAAFPALTELLQDPVFVSDAERRAVLFGCCVALGREAAIPYLRPLLGDETVFGFGEAAEALAVLHDTESTPRLMQALAGSARPRARADAARALGVMRDDRAVPAMIAALKDDGYLANYGPEREVWAAARNAIWFMTGCRLSANGDKAERWWGVAHQLDPTAWRHFAAAQRIESLLLVSPFDQANVVAMVSGEAYARPEGPRRLNFGRADEYDPLTAQEEWRAWLEAQGWDDYQALPSQIDDELALEVEPMAVPEDAGAVHLRYILTNRTPRDLWLYKHPDCPVATRWRDGGGSGGALGAASDEGATGAEGFFLLRSGGQALLVSQQPLAGPPAAVAGGLRFLRKGTSLGREAWVGEVWSEPVVVSAEPGL